MHVNSVSVMIINDYRPAGLVSCWKTVEERSVSINKLERRTSPDLLTPALIWVNFPSTESSHYLRPAPTCRHSISTPFIRATFQWSSYPAIFNMPTHIWTWAPLFITTNFTGLRSTSVASRSVVTEINLGAPAVKKIVIWSNEIIKSEIMI